MASEGAWQLDDPTARSSSPRRRSRSPQLAAETWRHGQSARAIALAFGGRLQEAVEASTARWRPWRKMGAPNLAASAPCSTSAHSWAISTAHSRGRPSIERWPPPAPRRSPTRSHGVHVRPARRPAARHRAQRAGRGAGTRRGRCVVRGVRADQLGSLRGDAATPPPAPHAASTCLPATSPWATGRTSGASRGGSSRPWSCAAQRKPRPWWMERRRPTRRSRGPSPTTSAPRCRAPATILAPASTSLTPRSVDDRRRARPTPARRRQRARRTGCSAARWVSPRRPSRPGDDDHAAVGRWGVAVGHGCRARAGDRESAAMVDQLSPMEAIMWRVGQDPMLRMTVGALSSSTTRPSKRRWSSAWPNSPTTRRACGGAPTRARPYGRGPCGSTTATPSTTAPSGGWPSPTPVRCARCSTWWACSSRCRSTPPFAVGRHVDRGPEGGKAAVYLRAHHVLTDGVGGIRLLGHLVDEPTWPHVPAPSEHGESAPAVAAPTVTADAAAVAPVDPRRPSDGGSALRQWRPARHAHRLDRSAEHGPPCRRRRRRRCGGRGQRGAVARDIHPVDTTIRALQRALDVANSVSRQLMVTGGSLSRAPRAAPC